MTGELLVTDANILIDYYQADQELVYIICKEFKVKISKIVMDEITQFTYAEAIEFGIEILETVDSNNLQFPQVGRLSLQDKSCIVLAHKLKAYYCLTNDKRLKAYLEQEGFKVYWGLEMILLLMAKNYFNKERATQIANRIFEINFWYRDDVKKDFWEKLEGVHK